jgi:hypothetical protein
MKEIDPSGQTSEQLLAYLDTQLALQRARKKAPGRNRTLFLVFGVLFIICAAAAALLFLEEMLANARKDGHSEPQAQAAPGGNF